MQRLARSSKGTRPLSHLALCSATLCAILLFGSTTQATYIAPHLEKSSLSLARPLASLFSRDSMLNATTNFAGRMDTRHWRLSSGSGQTQAPYLAPLALPGDEHWMPGFILNGTSGSVQTLATDGNNVYVGGLFTIIGGTVANNIAKWNSSTNTWSALGSGVNSTVFALAVDRGGNLYAGGDFNTAGGVAVNLIAKWDGSTWSALGSGMDHEVNSLAVDYNGNLYAGGIFTTAGGVPANNIAKWNVSTNTWSALGSGMSGGNYYNPPVHALAVDRDGNVYAGGVFYAAGGVSANYIAKWNASTNSWQALGTGMSGGSSDGTVVTALTVDNDGNLYAGGDFTFAGGVSANNIAKWNVSTKTWSALGSGVSGGWYRTSPRGLAVYGGNLYAAGDFTIAGGISANRVAKWNGNNWEALGSGTSDVTNPIAIDNFGNVYVGGLFTVAGDVRANHIAKWNGNNWSVMGPVDNSINSAAYALAVNSSNNVYVGGDFTTAGGAPANFISQWNGSTWSALSSGMNGGVSALAVDSNNNLYAGGGFTMSGGINTNNIAKWDGSRWTALGSGVNGGVAALATDRNGDVFAGGYFTNAGGNAANNIAKWNVSTNNWEALGSGINGRVSALAVDRNGSLYAGGWFTKTGDLTVNYVAKWNGNTWSALGTGVCCGGTTRYGFDITSVSALAVDGNGHLYVGGRFSQAGGVSANNVAKWNGSNWQALDSGITTGPTYYGPFVHPVAVDATGNLYVGGDITMAGGIAVQGIAKWDGSSWSALGSGIPCFSNSVLALATDSNGNIYAGGSFTMAGGKPSAHFAKWTALIYQSYFPWVDR